MAKPRLPRWGNVVVRSAEHSLSCAKWPRPLVFRSTGYQNPEHRHRVFAFFFGVKGLYSHPHSIAPHVCLLGFYCVSGVVWQIAKERDVANWWQKHDPRWKGCGGACPKGRLQFLCAEFDYMLGLLYPCVQMWLCGPIQQLFCQETLFRSARKAYPRQALGQWCLTLQVADEASARRSKDVKDPSK